MNSPHAKDRFVEWTEGALSDGDRAALEQHLEACAECAMYYRKMSELLQERSLEFVPHLSADPYLVQRVRARAQPLTWLRTPAGRLATGAVFGLAIFVGVFVGRYAATRNAGGEQSLVDAYYEAFTQSSASWDDVIGEGEL
jgi:anti-sigma factor RsiW